MTQDEELAKNDYYNVKWVPYQSDVLSTFQDYFKEEMFVDVELNACRNSISAHKIILSASSTYFENLFKKYPHLSSVDCDISDDDLTNMIRFIYWGTVDIKFKKLKSFLKTAKQLQLKWFDFEKLTETAVDVLFEEDRLNKQTKDVETEKEKDIEKEKDSEKEKVTEKKKGIEMAKDTEKEKDTEIQSNTKEPTDTPAQVEESPVNGQLELALRRIWLYGDKLSNVADYYKIPRLFLQKYVDGVEGRDDKKYQNLVKEWANLREVREKKEKAKQEAAAANQPKSAVKTVNTKNISYNEKYTHYMNQVNQNMHPNQGRNGPYPGHRIGMPQNIPPYVQGQPNMPPHPSKFVPNNRQPIPNKSIKDPRLARMTSQNPAMPQADIASFNAPVEAIATPFVNTQNQDNQVRSPNTTNINSAMYKADIGNYAKPYSSTITSAQQIANQNPNILQFQQVPSSSEFFTRRTSVPNQYPMDNRYNSSVGITNQEKNQVNFVPSNNNIPRHFANHHTTNQNVPVGVPPPTVDKSVKFLPAASDNNRFIPTFANRYNTDIASTSSQQSSGTLKNLRFIPATDNKFLSTKNVATDQNISAIKYISGNSSTATSEQNISRENPFLGSVPNVASEKPRIMILSSVNVNNLDSPSNIFNATPKFPSVETQDTSIVTAAERNNTFDNNTVNKEIALQQSITENTPVKTLYKSNYVITARPYKSVTDSDATKDNATSTKVSNTSPVAANNNADTAKTSTHTNVSSSPTNITPSRIDSENVLLATNPTNVDADTHDNATSSQHGKDLSGNKSPLLDKDNDFENIVAKGSGQSTLFSIDPANNEISDEENISMNKQSTLFAIDDKSNSDMSLDTASSSDHGLLYKSEKKKHKKSKKHSSHHNRYERDDSDSDDAIQDKLKQNYDSRFGAPKRYDSLPSYQPSFFDSHASNSQPKRSKYNEDVTYIPDRLKKQYNDCFGGGPRKPAAQSSTFDCYNIPANNDSTYDHNDDINKDLFDLDSRSRSPNQESYGHFGGNKKSKKSKKRHRSNSSEIEALVQLQEELRSQLDEPSSSSSLFDCDSASGKVKKKKQKRKRFDDVRDDFRQSFRDFK